MWNAHERVKKTLWGIQGREWKSARLLAEFCVASTIGALAAETSWSLLSVWQLSNNYSQPGWHRLPFASSRAAKHPRICWVIEARILCEKNQLNSHYEITDRPRYHKERLEWQDIEGRVYDLVVILHESNNPTYEKRQKDSADRHVPQAPKICGIELSPGISQLPTVDLIESATIPPRCQAKEEVWSITYNSSMANPVNQTYKNASVAVIW